MKLNRRRRKPPIYIAFLAPRKFFANQLHGLAHTSVSVHQPGKAKKIGNRENEAAQAKRASRKSSSDTWQISVNSKHLKQDGPQDLRQHSPKSHREFAATHATTMSIRSRQVFTQFPPQLSLEHNPKIDDNVHYTPYRNFRCRSHRRNQYLQQFLPHLKE